MLARTWLQIQYCKMNFERNTVSGFVVLAMLFFGYFYFNNQQQVAYQKQKAKQDSIAKANQPKITTTPQRTDSLGTDSIQRPAIAGDFGAYSTGTEQTTVVENDVIKVTFSNK